MNFTVETTHVPPGASMVLTFNDDASSDEMRYAIKMLKESLLQILKEKLDVLRLTFYTAPVSVAVLVPFFFYSEYSNLLAYRYDASSCEQRYPRIGRCKNNTGLCAGGSL